MAYGLAIQFQSIVVYISDLTRGLEHAGFPPLMDQIILNFIHLHTFEYPIRMCNRR